MQIAGGRFLVTGGASLIGSHLTQQLLEAGAAAVILFDNYALGSPEVAASLAQDRRVTAVRGDITRALATLPEAYRTAIVLADVEGWTWEEVAAILAVPIGTVQSRVFRARRALRTLLKDYAPR